LKDDKIYLLHIRDALQHILDYTEEGKDSFFEDSKTQDAVVRNLEIVGEAVKNLSPQFKSFYPEIHWKAISGMRDKLIHEYFGVNLNLGQVLVGLLQSFGIPDYCLAYIKIELSALQFP